jgi:hypothetical protein
VQCDRLKGTFRRRVHNIENTVLRNVGSHLPDYMVSYTRRIRKNHHCFENLETPIAFFLFLKIQQHSTQLLRLFIYLFRPVKLYVVYFNNAVRSPVCMTSNDQIIHQ